MASQVLEFVNTLLPRQEKQQLLDEIQRTQSEMVTLTIPMYEKAQAMATHNAYRSDMFKEYNAAAKLHVTGHSGHVVKDTLKALKNHNENLTRLSEIIMRDTGDNITIESITYRKANVLQLIAGIQGFTRYATRLLGFLWLCETGDIELKSITQIRQPEYLWLAKHRSQFYAVLEVGLKKPDRLAKSINNLPDMSVDVTTDASVESAIAKQDTMIRNFTVSWSPILHIRRFLDMRKEAEVERLKKERAWLDDCYARAKSAQESGQKNPAVEKRLKVYGEELGKVDRKLERLSTNPE